MANFVHLRLVLIRSRVIRVLCHELHELMLLAEHVITCPIAAGYAMNIPMIVV